MIKLRMLVLACGVTLAAGPLAPVAPAQGKPPPIKTKEVKKDTFADLLRNYQQTGSYRFVSGDESLTSGQFVTITRKDKGKVSGVFVYADPKSNKLYIRPKAGATPVAVPSNEIEHIDLTRPAGTGTTGKGGIKPAIETGEKSAPSYEIHTLTIHDGPMTRTFHYETSLSDAERNQLNALERARTDLLQKRTRVESLSEMIDNAATAPPVTIAQGGPGVALAPYFAPYAFYGYYPGFYNPFQWNWPGYSSGWSNYGYEIPALAYYPAYGGFGTYGGYGGAGGGSTVVVTNPGSTGQNVAELTKALKEAQTALNDAEKAYVAANQRAIFDNDGRIVAVRLAE